MLQRLGHMRARGVGPDGALRDFASQLHHFLAERGQGERGKLASLTDTSLQVMDKAAYITERFANGETEAVIGRPVTDTDTKTKAPLRQFMNERCGLGIVHWMARIDVRNAGAEGDVVRCES